MPHRGDPVEATLSFDQEGRPDFSCNLQPLLRVEFVSAEAGQPADRPIEQIVMTTTPYPVPSRLASALVAVCLTALPLTLAAAGLEAAGEAKIDPEHLRFFETKIRPLLADACYKCHSEDAGKTKGGLALDSKQALLQGGDSGAAIVPGSPSRSLLIEAIHWKDEDMQMPPKEKLSDEQIADLEKWVRLGAPDPREGAAPLARTEIDIETARDFWAYQLPKVVDPPTSRQSAWARTDIDKFIAAGLDAKGLKPVADADKQTLLRRAYFDLVGLPPKPAEVKAFLDDESTNAFEKVVDRLLASEQFGERWGRHWLDVARYAESSGKEANFTFPHAWRYRDYVIDAFNADKPFDQFVKEQIAGDLLPATSLDQKREQMVATGFLALGAKSLNAQNPRQFAMDVADEQIDTLSRALLGTTIACARCHDHKFDPIPTHEYYALAGIFLSTETLYGTPRVQGNRRASELLRITDDSEPVDPGRILTASERARMEQFLEEAKEQRQDMFVEARQARQRGESPDNGQNQAQRRQQFRRLNDRINTLEARLDSHDELGIPRQFAMGARDREQPIDARILVRGELDKAGDRVERGFISVLSPSAPPRINPEASGRLELAEWLVSRDNPLTARVMANRIWMHLIGRGLVASVDNFGSTGEAPSHPELLDWLAVQFQKNGWSVKSLVKDIVMSRAYQLGSAFDRASYDADPENTLLWRANKKRLEAEAIRDALLAVSGQLDLKRPHGSSVLSAGDGYVGRNIREDQIKNEHNHRSVYLPIVRDMVPDSLAVFDFAETSLVTGKRDNTTVPSQALYMMNSDHVTRAAERLAATLAQSGGKGAPLIERAYLLALSRKPSESEMENAVAFFRDFTPAVADDMGNRDRIRFAGLVGFCQALFASAEFRYLN